MNEWQPIETAPKDGSDVLVYRVDAGVILARFIAPCNFLSESEGKDISNEDWDRPDWFYADFIAGGRLSNEGLPTHWMPLPDPPQ